MLPDPDSLFGQTETAEDINALLSSALEAVERARLSDPALLAQSLTGYIRQLMRDAQYDQAVACAREVLELETHTENAVEAVITLGICAAQGSNLALAEQYFHRAADLARKINYPLGIARAQQNYVKFILITRGQFQLALTLLEEITTLRESLGRKHWSEPILQGYIYQILGDRRHCRQILDELVLQVEPGTRLAAAYYFLWARLALDEEELEQAKEYLRLGLRLANRIQMVDLSLLIGLEFSRYSRQVNDFPTARAWADEVFQQAGHHQEGYHAGLALIERAQANWAAGDPAQATADLQEACQALEMLGASYDLARARFLRALWFQQAGQPDAETVWVEAIAFMVRHGYVFILEKNQEQAFPLIAAHMRSKTPAVRKATEDLLKHLANVPPPSLRIATLGQFAVWKGRLRIADQAWTRRKSGELLRYLLLQPARAAGREVIIEALWPDHNSDSPADLLHQATSALRHALEPDLPDKFPSRYLKVEGEHIVLALPPGSVVDLEQFERALPLAIQARSIDRLQEALTMYAGDLFPSDRYADWSTEQRQSLAELRQRGLLSLAQAYLDHGQYYQVITCTRQILEVDNWNEDAVLLAMRAYAGLQDVPHALGVYQNLEKTLKSELDIIPRSDLRAYAAELRRR